MSNRYLPNVGDKIIIQIDRAYHIKTKCLISQVIDSMDDRMMLIATPIVNGVVTPISVDEILKIKYSKKNIGICAFKARTIERKKAENISYIKIKRIGDVARDQRRNFFRLEVLLDVKFKMIHSSDHSTTIVHALTKDISGGGIRLMSKEKLEEGCIGQLIIETEKKNIVVQGKVIRCTLHEEEDGQYDMAIKFQDIDEKTRTEIISFIFEHQRKMRQKGLI